MQDPDDEQLTSFALHLHSVTVEEYLENIARTLKQAQDLEVFSTDGNRQIGLMRKQIIRDIWNSFGYNTHKYKVTPYDQPDAWWLRDFRGQDVDEPQQEFHAITARTLVDARQIWMDMKQRKIKRIPCPKSTCSGVLHLTGMVNKFIMACKVCKKSWRETEAKNYLFDYRTQLGTAEDVQQNPAPTQLRIVRRTIEQSGERAVIKEIEKTARFIRLKGNKWKYYVTDGNGRVKFGQGQTKSKTKSAELIYQTFGNNWKSHVAQVKELQTIPEEEQLATIPTQVECNVDNTLAQDNLVSDTIIGPLNFTEHILQDYDDLSGGQGSSTNPYPNRPTLADLFAGGTEPEY
jgi:hypothetical protein